MSSEPPVSPSAQPTPSQTINIQSPAVPAGNGMAVASLVLGIIAICLFWVPFLGWIPVILGLVLGLIALQRPDGRGMAVAGVVCSAIALAIKLWFWVALIGFFATRHHF